MTIGTPIPDTIRPWKFKVKGQGQKYPPVSAVSSRLVSLVSHQAILSTPAPFVPWQSGLPFPRYNLTVKIKVKDTPVSAASSWLISSVFYIRASYRLLSLSFHDNRASLFRDTIWPWKFKVSVVSSWIISSCFTSFAPTIPKICQIECSTRETDFKFHEKKLLKTKFRQNLGKRFPLYRGDKVNCVPLR